jgi:peptide/nickel transport system substrate-binding protein
MQKLKTRRWQAVIVAIVIIACMISYGSYQLFFKPPPPPMRLVVSKIAEADTLDPAISSMVYAQQVGEAIFDRYLAYDDQGVIQPALAESYQWSPDGKILTLNLRRDVKFHNGDPFNATAVKYSLERILDPNMKSPAAASLAEVTKIEVADTNTAKIYLKAPDRFFLDRMTGYDTGSPVCPSVAQKLGKDFGTTNPVGTGPFKFKEWRRDDYVLLVKNKDYTWAPKFTGHTGPALIDELLFKVIPEDTTRMADIRTPEGAHIATAVPAIQVAKLTEDPNIKILTATEPTVVFLSMNTARMTDLRVRLAVAYAIDRDPINKAINFGTAQPGYSPLSPTYGPFYEDMVKTGKAKLYDTKKSAALLDEAGWKLGADGYRYKDGNMLELTAVQYTNIELMTIVQDQLKKVGIKMNLVEFRGDRQGWFSRLTAGTFDMTSALLRTTAPMLEWFFAAKQQPWPNWMRVDSTDLESLIQLSATTPDDKIAYDAYYKVQDIIVDNAYWVPLFYPQNIVAIRSNVLNYKLPARTTGYMYLSVTIAK